MKMLPLDETLLRWLLRLPCLRLDDLAPLTPASRSTVARHLHMLVRAGYVARLDVAQSMSYPAGQCLAYHLTHNGILQTPDQNLLPLFWSN